MSFYKTLSCLFILAYLFNFSFAHNCVHDQLEYKVEKAPADHHHKFFVNHASTNYQYIRMAFDYSNTQKASADMQFYIKEILMPPVKSYFEAALKVIPRFSRLYVPSNFCAGLITIPSTATTYGYEGDTVIFVATVNEPSASYLARSLPCGVDPTTNRPTIGLIIFNTAYINLDMKTITLETDLSTTLHEITHVLGFSKNLYNLYINPDTLKPLTGHVFNRTVNGVPTMVLDVPPLTQRLRAHFNCSTLEGAYLENQGGPGSFGAHFERRVFFNEFMTANDIRDPRFSEFSLALLEGTGWYKPQYYLAEPMTYGKNAGCDFLKTKCVNPETKQTAFKEFCSPLTSRGIFWTRRAFGICGVSTPRASNDLVSEFDYWGNKTVMVDSFADNCPQIQAYGEFDCEDVDQAANSFLSTYEYYGIGAKAFMGTLARGSYAYAQPVGYCFKTQCLKKEDGNYALKVLFGTAGYATCSAAGKILPSSSNFSFRSSLAGSLECPDPNDFCNQVLSEGYCKGSCYGNGICKQDGCQCFEGWGTYNCALRKLDDNCSGCDQNSNYTTCYGNQCVCNPANITCMCALGRKTGAECLNLNNNTNNNTDNGNTNPNTNPNPNNGNTNPNTNQPSNVTFSPDAIVITGIVILIVLALAFGQYVKKRNTVSMNNNDLSNPITYCHNQSLQRIHQEPSVL